MYILIDRERMVLLHKHLSITVLCNLAWIECKNAAYCVFKIDDACGFKIFTDMELKLLYRNITTLDVVNLNRSQLLQVLYNLCERVVATDALETEAEVQAQFIKEETEGAWLYVKGAKRPAKKADLFLPVCRKAAKSEKEESLAIGGKLEALKANVQAVPLPTRKAKQESVSRQGVSSVQAPKRGTAKAIIWNIADKLWEDAGKPVGKNEVLGLRKQIMSWLETNEGIKRASSSSELGKWHKTRVPI